MSLSGAFGPLFGMRGVNSFRTSIRSYARDAPKFIISEITGKNKNIGLITLNRPKALNALCAELMDELDGAVDKFNKDPTINVMVFTGKGKAFIAGADIKEMSGKTFSSVYCSGTDFFLGYNSLAKSPKPVIAAVNGIAFGGGCELAMSCDIIYASETAQFGQPEINLGIIPGGAGTQRLPRAIGKSKAMEACMTGATFSAQEAEKWGLISKVFPEDQLMPATMALAETIARQSQVVTRMIKQCIATSYETTLEEGLQTERRFFATCFATDDQKEGMTAFIEKRKPKFQGK